MLIIQKKLISYENDINDILHIFEKYLTENDVNVSIKSRKIKNNCKIQVDVNNISLSDTVKIINDDLIDKRLIKRKIKSLLYFALSKFFNVEMPWGSLTGVRPSKIVYDLLKDGYNFVEIKDILVYDFGVSDAKANLIIEVVQNQVSVKLMNNEVDLYINIPICPTRCSYCSFISSELFRCEKYLDDYIDCLIKEINSVKNLISEKGLKIKNIYMGGGTPTTLSSVQLDKILSTIDFGFNEFTVECGRPDTISEDKLNVLKNHNVTRISINPQTLNDETLLLIGRKHTSLDFYDKFELASKYGFIINTDIIAGLPNENFTKFKKTLDSIIKLQPNNITVHTLAVKRASIIKASEQAVDDSYIQEMVEYAYKTLKANKYEPYYLYRQKNMLGLYENVGYYKNGDICEFNVESMEEKADIIACGAGAISKRIFWENNRIERTANVKQIKDYIERIDEMIQRKENFFK